jgi:antitoxin (DNA-binding transcriptional repressor) of toxin-antitoxin stability system
VTVRRLEVADATESLAAYIRKAAGCGPVVITDEGHPIAALVMLEGTDLESVALSTDPEFLALIQSSRARHAQEEAQGIASDRIDYGYLVCQMICTTRADQTKNAIRGDAHADMVAKSSGP